MGLTPLRDDCKPTLLMGLTPLGSKVCRFDDRSYPHWETTADPPKVLPPLGDDCGPTPLMGLTPLEDDCGPTLLMGIAPTKSLAEFTIPLMSFTPTRIQLRTLSTGEYHPNSKSCKVWRFADESYPHSKTTTHSADGSHPNSEFCRVRRSADASYPNSETTADPLCWWVSPPLSVQSSSLR